VLPIWICPVTPGAAAERFTLFPLPRRRYVNFGFWDVVRTRAHRPDGYLNRRIEQRVQDLGGLKSLYATSYFTATQFWTMFDRDAYAALKQRYDPDGHFEGLYEKCVLGR
jgi:FAD/FMN-containing dehydrogenase